MMFRHSSTIATLLITLVLALSASMGVAEEERVIVGLPTVQVLCDPMGQCARRELTTEQTEEHRLVLRQEGEEPTWESREDETLHAETRGVFDVFVGPGGYVKILREGADGLHPYLEHRSQGMMTITFYGRAHYGAPPKP